jgi:hypothetical protein
MDLTEGSETSANINQTPGKHPEVDTVNTEHGESLKSVTTECVSLGKILHEAFVKRSAHNTV